MRKSICSKTEVDTNFDSLTHPMDNIYFDGIVKDLNIVKDDIMSSPKRGVKKDKKVVFKENFIEIVNIESIKYNYEEKRKDSGSCIVRLFNRLLCVE